MMSGPGQRDKAGSTNRDSSAGSRVLLKIGDSSDALRRDVSKASAAHCATSSSPDLDTALQRNPRSSCGIMLQPDIWHLQGDSVPWLGIWGEVDVT